MSDSFHVTRTDLKGRTKQEIDEMVNDPDSLLHELVEKRITKKAVKRQRKIEKKVNDTDRDL